MLMETPKKTRRRGPPGQLSEAAKELIKKQILDDTNDSFLAFCNKNSDIIGTPGSNLRRLAQKYRSNLIIRSPDCHSVKKRLANKRIISKFPKMSKLLFIVSPQSVFYKSHNISQVYRFQRQTHQKLGKIHIIYYCFQS